MKKTYLNYIQNIFSRPVITVVLVLTVASLGYGQQNCNNLPNWSSTDIYTQGDQVQHGGTAYEAKWWTQNQNPSTHSSQWAVWKILGSCDPGENNPPAVNISSPSEGSVFTAGSQVVISADATDSDGNVTNVAFYQNGILIGNDNSSPYSISWNNVQQGSYVLTAIATDNLNATTTSSGINIMVQNGGNQLPVGNISSPTHGDTFTAGDNVEIHAAANDPDGQVANVSFFQNGNHLSTDASSPYSFVWDNVATGNYDLTIQVTDNDGGVFTSTVVSISVVSGSGGCSGVPQYVEAGGYEAGSEVQNGGDRYECKEWPYSGWCDGDAGAYAPGTGSHWQDAWYYRGECGSTGGENQSPTVVINSPGNGSTFQPGSNIQIVADASDADGTVAKVEFFQGNTLLGEDTVSPYAFTWSNVSQGSYSITARVTDDEAAQTVSSPVFINVTTDGGFNGELPDRLLVGYWHNFDNGSGVVKLRDVSEKWDVINIAFAEPTSQGGASMAFLPDDAIYASTDEFKNDVALLQSQGKKVLISIGGANGTIHLENSVDAQNFSSTMTGIISEYGFDGLDIDLEGSSLSLGAGDSDFRFPSSPRVVYFIEGMDQVLANFGADFILSAAPETAYVQGGYSTYGGIFGAYLPVLYHFQSRMDYIHVQHYNTGCMLGLDDRCYSQGTADFQVAMGEMLLQGFPVAGNPTSFPPFRQDQVAIGLPASPSAAGGGYTNPNTVKTALDYLVLGIPYGGTYTLINSSGYADFRGLMTWSINWDIHYNYEFSDNYRAYLDGLSGARITNSESDRKELEKGLNATLDLQVWPNPVVSGARFVFELQNPDHVRLAIYSQIGQETIIYDGELSGGRHEMHWNDDKLAPGVYLLKIKTGSSRSIKKLIKR